jgi:uncharacterized protein YgiM (DUF1202 family)
MAPRNASELVRHAISVAAACLVVVAAVSLFSPLTQREIVATAQTGQLSGRVDVPLRPSYIVPVTPVAPTAEVTRIDTAPLTGSLSVQPVASPADAVDDEPQAEKWYVTAAALNVRSAPSNAGQPIGRLPFGTEVVVASTDGNWLEISTEAGVSGWVFGKYLSQTAP